MHVQPGGGRGANTEHAGEITEPIWPRNTSSLTLTPEMKTEGLLGYLFALCLFSMVWVSPKP